MMVFQTPPIYKYVVMSLRRYVVMSLCCYVVMAYKRDNLFIHIYITYIKYTPRPKLISTARLEQLKIHNKLFFEF